MLITIAFRIYQRARILIMKRLSKGWKAGLIGAAAVALMVATVPLAIWITHTATAQEANQRARCQSTMQPVHKVFIRGDKAIPNHVTALQCDSLEFINQDKSIKLIAFGPHEHHISYDGVSEKALAPGQSFSVKLVQTGSLSFHDHISDTAQGIVTVSK